MLEGPGRDRAALISPGFIGEAEMNPFQNTRLHHVCRSVRESAVRTRCVGYRAGDRERYSVSAEKELQHLCRGAAEIIGAGRVVGIIRCSDERFPRWIADGQRIAVSISISDCRLRPPKMKVDL